MEGHFALTHLHRSGKVFARSRDKQNKPVFIIQGNSFSLHLHQKTTVKQGVCVPVFFGGGGWVRVVSECVHVSEKNPLRK